MDPGGLYSYQRTSDESGDSAHRKSSMTKTIRRKSETVRLANDRDLSHLLELAFPPGGVLSVSLDINAFQCDPRIPFDHIRSRHDVMQVYIRFCFPDTACGCIPQSLRWRMRNPRTGRPRRME